MLFCLRKVVRMVPAREWAGAALVGATGSCGQLSGMGCYDFMPHRQVHYSVCRGAMALRNGRFDEFGDDYSRSSIHRFPT